MTYQDTVRRRQARPAQPGKIIDQDGRDVPDDARGPFSGGASGQFGMGGKARFGPLTREQRIARVDALSKLLDAAFVLPGTNIRYGLDGLIGLVPVIGDLLTTAIALWIVREAKALGAPWHVRARMYGNVAVDGVIGIVPVAGDAFDVMFKANLRNVRILRRWLEKNG